MAAVISSNPASPPSRDLETLVNLLESYRAARAARLGRQADVELQHGHFRAAERLANLAAAMREARAGAEGAR